MNKDIGINKKINIIKYRIEFWEGTLNIAQESYTELVNYGDKLKINMIIRDIQNKKDMINFLKNTLQDLEKLV